MATWFEGGIRAQHAIREIICVIFRLNAAPRTGSPYKHSKFIANLDSSESPHLSVLSEGLDWKIRSDSKLSKKVHCLSKTCSVNAAKLVIDGIIVD